MNRIGYIIVSEDGEVNLHVTDRPLIQILRHYYHEVTDNDIANGRDAVGSHTPTHCIRIDLPFDADFNTVRFENIDVHCMEFKDINADTPPLINRYID